MKKLLIVFFILIAVKASKSDQLAWITKEQADKTIEYFEEKEISQVVLWCACCDSDTKTLVRNITISYKKADDPNYYEIYIKGSGAGGIKIYQPVDLAYVHIKRGGKWRCLGKELKFECDPCTEAFKL